MRLTALILALGVFATPLRAQYSWEEFKSIAGVAAQWSRHRAPPGAESATGMELLADFSSGDRTGWSADSHMNLIKRVGSGTPKRVVACGLDFSSYVVSQITDQGYLRVRRSGTAGHPLWDQFHEAQRVAIRAARGWIPGVVAVANGHFTQQHRGDTLAATMDDLWVDVGASSRAEVGRLGIELIDPVAIDRPVWTFNGYASGPAAGARTGCAVVAAAANGRVASGETIFIISQQKVFGWRGLAAALARIGPVQSLTLLDDGTPFSPQAPAVTITNRFAQQRHGGVSRTARADTIRVLSPKVRFARTLVETVHASDVQALYDAVLAAAALGPEAPRWVGPTNVVPGQGPHAPRGNSLDEIEETWRSIIDLPGVAGHERPVRDAVLAALPAWARRIAKVDSIGNVIVAMGPDRDSVAFIAHMDEVGFEITNILSDGRVVLRTRGGAVVPSWEGTPALLHFDSATAPLRGVFIPRDTGRLRAPTVPPGSTTTWLTAWFGMDSASLVARGVRPGLSLTSHKEATRLAGTRVTGRGSDDRSGSTALLWAIKRIRPDSLRGKVFFVWSVQEEGGLNGARYFGDTHSAVNLKRVYSIDTFVTSDTPLESPHFAHAPLGNGAVLRALDNSSLVPYEDRQRIIRIARERNIPLQVGTTFGGTDGSAIQMWGPNNIGLSWPGRYSHGPAEVLDLRDLEALARLIVAVATAR